jgi:hypothetical protein
MYQVKCFGPRWIHRSMRLLISLLFASVLPLREIQPAAAAPLSEEAAVQDTITRASAEQVDALAAADPLLMADTSTPEHLQELTHINEDLLASGTTNIELVGLAWGAISINDQTATAITYETWTTTRVDDSTLEVTDENDYTLVLEEGTWKIAEDTHPSNSTTGAVQPAVSEPEPMPPTSGDSESSRNWAGYAAVDGSFTAVSGTWTVPASNHTGPTGISASWVGIGGVESEDLIQAGTVEETDALGRRQYSAWIETLPQPSRTIPLVVNAGDTITVAITEKSASTWLITLTNVTRGQNYRQTLQYTSLHSSAEWIEEAPSSTRGRILPLDNFGTVAFSRGSTIKDGKTLTIASASGIPIAMTTPSHQTLAVPSSLGTGGDSFTVTRTGVVTAQGMPGLGAYSGTVQSVDTNVVHKQVTGLQRMGKFN